MYLSSHLSFFFFKFSITYQKHMRLFSQPLPGAHSSQKRVRLNGNELSSCSELVKAQVGGLAGHKNGQIPSLPSH